MDSDKSITANFSAIAPPEERKKGGVSESPLLELFKDIQA